MNEFDEAVAKDHLARRDREIFAGLERLGADGLAAARRAPQILQKILESAQEIGPALLQRALLRLRIGEQKIRRRIHIEKLPRNEVDDIFVLLGDAADVGGRAVPPLLIEQEGLVNKVIGPPPPLLAQKPLVLRQGLDARRRLLALERGARGVSAKPRRLAPCLFGELHLLAGRSGEMHGPIPIGAGERGGRKTAGEMREIGVQSAIGGVGQRRAGRRFAVRRLDR